MSDSFDSPSSNFPFPSPTAPAPGPSLLDDNESKFLDSFFDGVSSDNFNYDFLSNVPDHPDSGIGWNELPPAFMGTTSSFGQQPQIAHGLPDITFGSTNSHMGNATHSVPSSATPDVLAAASLLQTGSAVRSHSISNEALFRGHASTPVSTNGQLRAHSASQYLPAKSNTSLHESPVSDEYMRDTFYTEMMFGPQTSSTVRPRHPNAKLDIRWGSDSGFGAPQGFTAPTNQEKVAAFEEYQLKTIETALKPRYEPDSADTTRPSSPVQSFASVPNQRARAFPQLLENDDEDSRPRKRRKSKVLDEGDDDDESPTSTDWKNGSKKRSFSKKASSTDSPTRSLEPNSKRTKSTPAVQSAAKAARENLTEDQKRENHIKSEQKRRTLIREGFEDLNELVPGLRGGGFSKSAVLIMAADWLEELMQGNDGLHKQLESLHGNI
jgi:hypothetical protein